MDVKIQRVLFEGKLLAMMNDKDKRVVEEMCAAGMSLEALYKIFKQFEADDLKNIYVEYHKGQNDYVEEGINISINCS